jgi:steroid delta-isomerase-like uncharacterized protein
MTDGTNVTDANRALVQRVFDEFNAGNIDIIAGLSSLDFVDHRPPPGATGGTREAVVTAFRNLKEAVPDLRWDVESIISQGDRVGMRATLRGTHTAPVLGLPPTGQAFAMSSLHIFRIADNRVVEHWANQDDWGLLQQLGAISAPA